MVLQRYEGMNIAREKPISVKNPQTTKQTGNRAKFKAASQIVAQFSEVINVRLGELSIYTRARRAAALSAIHKVVSLNNNTFEATFVDVLSGLNNKSMATIEKPTVAAGTDDAVDITAANGDLVTYIAVSYDTDGKMISREIESYTSDGTKKQVSPEENAYAFAVMAVAVRATTEAGRATLSNIAGINDVFTLNISRSVASGDLAISDIAGTMSAL